MTHKFIFFVTITTSKFSPKQAGPDLLWYCHLGKLSQPHPGSRGPLTYCRREYQSLRWFRRQARRASGRESTEPHFHVRNRFRFWTSSLIGFPYPFPGSTGSLAYNSSCDWLTRTTAPQVLKNQFSIDSQNNNNGTKKKITIYRVHFKMLYVTPYFLSSRKSGSLSQFKKNHCSSSFNAKMCSVLPTGYANRWCFTLFLLSDLMHDQGFSYAKNVVLVVICLLSSLIESHIQKLFFSRRFAPCWRGVARCSLASLATKNMNKNNLWHLGQ